MVHIILMEDIQVMEEAGQAEDLQDLQEEEEEREALTVETPPPLDKGGEGSTEM